MSQEQPPHQGQPPQPPYQGPPQGMPPYGAPGQFGPGAPGGPGFPVPPGGHGFPPPSPGPGPNKKMLAIGAAALGLVLLVGLVLILTSGGSDDDPVAVPPPMPSLATRTDLGQFPTTPASPAATGPYTKVTSPCGWASKDAVAKLVPFTEARSAASKDGASEDNAYVSCNWESKYQRGSAKQINRYLKVIMRLRISSEHKDAVSEAKDDMQYDLSTAKKDENGTDNIGSKYGAVTVPQIGEEAFTHSHLSKNVQYGDTQFRIGNYVVRVTYHGYDHPTKNFLDDSKDAPLPEDQARQGAEEIATQIAAGIKACTDKCTGAPEAPQTGPEDEPVQKIDPSWSKGVLKGLVDPCALVKQETLTRLIPKYGMQRIADRGYTSGKDQSTAVCVWTSDMSPDSPMRKINLRLWYRTSVAKSKRTFTLQKERVEKQANKTDTIGIEYGSVEEITGLADEAYVQAAVTTVPMGQAVLSMLVGNVAVDVTYSGSDNVASPVPLPADTVTAEAKAIAQDVLSLLRP